MIEYDSDVHDRVCDSRPFCLCAIALDPSDETYAKYSCECTKDPLGLSCVACGAVFKLFDAETGEEVKAA